MIVDIMERTAGAVRQDEGTSSSDPNYLTWTLTLDQASTAPVTVDVRYLAGTAIRGASNASVDAYAWSSFSPSSVTFAVGETAKTVSYRIDADSGDEVDETIVLEVINPVNAGLAGGATVLRATGWILDDDGFGENRAIYTSEPVITEGENGQKLASFELSMSRPAGSLISVSYQTRDGSAKAGEDYVATSGTATFAAGQTSTTVTVPIIGDTDVEPSELFTLSINTPTGVAQSSSGEALILDDDAGGSSAPVLSVAAHHQKEDTSSSDGLYLGWTLSLDKAPVAPVTVDLSYLAGSAIRGSSNGPVDAYPWSSSSPSSVTFAVGETSRQVFYRIDADSIDETDETIVLEITNPTNVALAGQVTVLRSAAFILDDDGFASNLALYASDPVLVEGQSGTSVARFDLSLSRPSDNPITVSYETRDGSAAAGEDYTATSGSITFAAGQVSASVDVPVLGDTTVEASELFTLAFSASSDVASVDAGEAVILDDDSGGQSAPTLTVTPHDQVESTSSNDALYLGWTLSLNQAATAPVTVDVRYLAGTATQGSSSANVDAYAWSSNSPSSVTFAVGEMSKKVFYRIDGDAIDEVDETIVLEVMNPVNVALAGQENVLRSAAFILDDDGFGENIAIFTTDPILVEGDSGVQQARFDLKLSRPITDKDITVSYNTADASGRAGFDYAAVSGDAVFKAGQTETSVFVPVYSDRQSEASKLFNLIVTAPSDIADVSVGEAEIFDDDAGQGSEPTISVSSAEQFEGTSNGDPLYLGWTISLDRAPVAPVTVDLRYLSGTATSGSSNADVDAYPWSSSSPSSLTFQVGETSKQVFLRIDGDAVDETDEAVTLEISNPINAQLAGSVPTLEAVGWILDDDGFGENIAVFVNAPTVFENVEGGSIAQFDISLSRPSDSAITFNYATADLSARAEVDYRSASGSITFEAGQTRASVEVDIVGSYTNEAAESFALNLSPNGAVASGFAGLSGNALILDNEPIDPIPPLGSDFNGDGIDDLLFFNATTRAVGQIAMPNATWSQIGVAGTGWSAIEVGHFDRDGSTDILWYNSNTKALGRFDMLEGAATWRGIGQGGGTWEVVGTGDFDGDGDDDIVWANEELNAAGQYRMENGLAQWRTLGFTGDDWRVVATGDFNGDQIDDVLWFNTQSGTLGQFRMKENGGKDWSAVTTLGAGWRVADTGDFNDDGYDDILVFKADTRQIGFFDMEDGTPSWTGLGGYGNGWSIEGTGDFDGDSDDDILWRNENTNAVGQYQMDGSEFTWDAITTAGAVWDIVL